MHNMSWRNKGIPLAIFVIFIIQISSPLVQFPVDELSLNDTEKESTIGFSSGSGHDLEGDLISIDGKNWTVRGESILDYWSYDIQDGISNSTLDLVVTETGIGYACSINGSDVNLHTIHLNGSFETLLVESWANGNSDECAIAVSDQDRIQVVYNNGDDLRLARLAEVNAVYLDRTWHLRTIAEDVFSSGLTISFDSESMTHIMFQNLDLALHHLWFNKAYWNQTILDEGPVGNDIEVQIDSDDIFHVTYTNSDEGEVRLIKFNETMEVRQVLARNSSITSAIGMDLDSNNIEQVTYSKSDGLGNNSISLLRSLAGKDTGRIDPDPKWIINYDDDSVEGTVASGDINGDSRDDLVYSDPDGNGTISIHYGSPDGPGVLADKILVGSYSNSNLGTGLAVGDFNCDGFDDLASSEPGYAVNNSGHISIRLGSATGITTSTWWELNGSDDDNLGWSLTTLGDVESDGCDDLAVVADKLIEENTATPTLTKNGLVMILKGNSTSMVHHANITQTGSGTMFGRQVAGGGDINGDGYLDMVISNTGNSDSPTGYSSVEFFLGNETGIQTVANKTHAPLQQGKLYGSEVEFVGDVDGDGNDDVLIAELFADTGLYHSGKVHMWEWSADGPISGQSTWSKKGTSANALFGSTISSAGDINEDGFDDFLIMSPSASKSGTVDLYLGSSNGPRTGTQLFAQGSAGENVGLNILAGMDLNGDGMGEILYSSRDLTRGDDFGPVLTIMSERDWEYVDFTFASPVVSIDMHTPLRGSPSMMVMLDDSSVNVMQNTLDGTPSGRWITRSVATADDAAMGISNSGKPLLLLVSPTNNTLATMTVEGFTGLDYTLNSGTGLGKMMGSDLDSNYYQRIGHASPDYSSIFYTEETANGFATTTVRTGIDLLYPIDFFVDDEDISRMVYVDDDDHMVTLATLNGTWGEESILNTTVGDDFDSTWVDDTLYFTQVALVNNSTVLQFVEYNGTSQITNIANVTANAEIEITDIDNKLVVSVIHSSTLTIYERLISGGNWTVAKEIWLFGITENCNLVMDGQVIFFDANNSQAQGMIIEEDGNWSVDLRDIPDTMTDYHLLQAGQRWHLTSTDSSNQMVWTTGELSFSDFETSTVFPSITTEYGVTILEKNGTLMMAYSQSSTDDFLLMRMVSDQDKDLIPDSHDDLPLIGNQWEDSDLDGYGDNSLGPEADSCPSSLGTSRYDLFGCEDYDDDGWSNANDDCVSDDGMSWWGQLGCDDYDQDGWADNSPTFNNGDRYPTNWKQALDSDRDSYGDNHGPDCCNVTVLGETEVNVPDLFPYNRMQWKDDDNDGYGDNESDVEFGDKCWWIQGFSWRDRLGCVDTDGDGASDPSDFGTSREWNIEDGADKWPEDGTQWADSDEDGFGDNSSDGATLPDKFPSNPAAANDTDNDGYPNNWTALENGTNRAGLFLDNCPNLAGNSTSSVDGTGSVVPYYGCTDTDGDGREDSTDAFPDEPTQFADSDGDGWGDNQNGVDPDACPFEYGVINGTLGVGCPIEGEEEDTDLDGVPDETDNCEGTQPGQVVDSFGCSDYQKDDDQDFVSNAEDMCPDTPIGEDVDAIGCSDSQKEVDSDGDGIFDPYDLCPNSNPELTIDDDGCNLSQKDTDQDGVNDLMDDCPGTEIGIPVLADGCLDEAALAEDIDGDGYKGPYSYNPDTETHEGDAFPLDSTQWEDMDGDGYGDSQAPGANNSDDCPEEWGNSSMKSRYGCLDSDGDGYHDFLGDDKFPTDGTQWEDKDLDSWGDNPDGNDPDLCLNTSTAGDRTAQARVNFGCADYQSDTDGDGITDDVDACPNTPAGAEVYPSGCKKEVETDSVEEDDLIMGMDSMMFFAVAGGGGIVFLLLIVFIISRIRSGGEFDLEDDDDDDWFDDDDDDDEDDFMSRIGVSTPARGPSRGPAGAGPSRGPPGAGPSRGPPGAGPSRGPPGAGPSRGPPGAGPSRGPPGAGPSRGPPGAGPSRGPDPRGPARGKKVAKKKLVDGGSAIRKTKVVIDPDLFSQEELVDRKAAIEWTISALKGGETERTILMQLQTTGWSAPQSRAIIDLSKQ